MSTDERFPDHNNPDAMGQDVVVEFTDEDGNVSYYAQESTFSVGDKTYALLVDMSEDAEEDEDTAYFARILKDEQGEDEYVDITDEEFEEAEAAYEKLMNQQDVSD